ncbi:tyrocidine synthetase 1 [Penicillium coprophilum]|uniref:tyrocidine synthetase 1 n=1 Tax=Penicillium coprophilum TaxID=36646 RepID=UPI00238E34C3|nr:tyrocidine synthetase 1 [Penicillium coprophilum]KAJ5178312.1 tyrocidine synthetase 1 [Penicillium coprophilum]
MPDTRCPRLQLSSAILYSIFNPRRIRRQYQYRLRINVESEDVQTVAPAHFTTISTLYQATWKSTLVVSASSKVEFQSRDEVTDLPLLMSVDQGVSVAKITVLTPRTNTRQFSQKLCERLL